MFAVDNVARALTLVLMADVESLQANVDLNTRTYVNPARLSNFELQIHKSHLYVYSHILST